MAGVVATAVMRMTWRSMIAQGFQGYKATRESAVSARGIWAKTT
jgi:hypothetical protein